MRGLPSILFIFHNEFNKFNNTGGRILDLLLLSIATRLINLEIVFFCVETLQFCHASN